MVTDCLLPYIIAYKTSLTAWVTKFITIGTKNHLHTKFSETYDDIMRNIASDTKTG